MLKPRAAAPTSNHDEVFAQRYRWLRDWALTLTNNNQQQAEDLVHDTFVQFILTRPNLAAIQQIDGYLYTMLRNLHVSHVRRAARLKETTFPLSDILSISDTASVESELRLTGQRTLAQSQDELCRICEYASLRKESSKVGSVVILRFFHGYYPAEIARVLHVSRAGVDKLLQRARTEANLYLTDPGRLTFISADSMNGMRGQATPQIELGQDLDDLMRELRERLYRSHTGECLNVETLRQLYSATDPIGSQDLGHIVCCRVCLESVNELLDLPTLSKRYPTAMNRRDKNQRKKGDGGGDDGGSGVSADDHVMSPARRRLREVFDHRPKELRVSVNGFILGSHGINSEFNKLSVSAKGEEKIGFVEVFSEADERLLFSVVEPPPQGPVEQIVRAQLSDRRTLELSLDFSESWPNVLVTYHDPTYNASDSDVLSLDEELESARQLIVGSTPREFNSEHLPASTLGGRLREWIDAGRNALSWKMLLRPAPVTAVFALILIASLLFYVRKPTPVLTAADVLRRASDAESIVGQADAVLHRTISLEEKNVRGELIARRKVEVWQSGAHGTTARRLYDEQGQLIAGDWRRQDGVQTLYQHGTRPKIQIGNRQSAIGNFDDVWQLSLSAKEFARLVGDTTNASVHEQPNAYLIIYENTNSGASRTTAIGSAPAPVVTPILVRSSLVLNRADLHPVEETLTLQRGSETREFHFIETSFERRAPDAVSPSVFEPEPELLSSANFKTRNPTVVTPDVAAPSPIAPSATANLEVEVLERLNQVGAFLGEQLTVSRDADGKLLVEGVVETSERKAEISRALGPVSKNPAVHVAIDTVAEAEARQRKGQSSAAVSVQGVEVAEQRIAVDAELRRYLQSRGLSGEQLEVELRRFSDRVLQHSLQARLQARALKQIGARFSPGTLASLDEAARSRWQTMIAQHARVCKQEIVALRRELQPLFPSLAGSAAIGSRMASDTAVLEGIKRLYELTVENDESLRRSFSLYANRPGDAPVRSQTFWGSLSSAEVLADGIGER